MSPAARGSASAAGHPRVRPPLAATLADLARQVADTRRRRLDTAAEQDGGQ